MEKVVNLISFDLNLLHIVFDVCWETQYFISFIHYSENSVLFDILYNLLIWLKFSVLLFWSLAVIVWHKIDQIWHNVQMTEENTMVKCVTECKTGWLQSEFLYFCNNNCAWACVDIKIKLNFVSVMKNRILSKM